MCRKVFQSKTILLILLALCAFTTLRAEQEASLFDLELAETFGPDTIQYLPVIILDSLKAKEIQPFEISYQLGYFKKRGTDTLSSFEKNYQNYLFRERLKSRTNHYIAITKPELVDYCNLNSFDHTLDKPEMKVKKIKVEGVDTPEVMPMPFTLEREAKKKENELWSFKGNLSLQFSQYYVTDNWYKGGTSNATFLNIFEYDIKYQKNRLAWENRFDVKIGFYNTTEDTIRAFRVNNDVFKIDSKLGYQTKWSKKWFYSAALDFNTSLFKGFKKTNSNEVVTSFLSPTRFFMSAGIEYKHSKNTTVRIAPAAYKVIFLLPHSDINPLTVGLDSTQLSKGYPGYLIQAKLNWKFSKEIQITSDFDLFSSYNFRNIEFDWETVGKFAINRFLSTRLSLIMRYDNTPKDKDAKIQIQEQLSFGFSYHFQ